MRSRIHVRLISMQHCAVSDRADKELFVLMACKASSSFKVDAAGNSPLDVHVSRLSVDQDSPASF